MSSDSHPKKGDDQTMKLDAYWTVDESFVVRDPSEDAPLVTVKFHNQFSALSRAEKLNHLREVVLAHTISQDVAANEETNDQR